MRLPLLCGIAGVLLWWKSDTRVTVSHAPTIVAMFLHSTVQRNASYGELGNAG